MTRLHRFLLTLAMLGIVSILALFGYASASGQVIQ